MQVAFGHSQLDSEARTLEREGQRVAVEPKVFDLLVYLIEHRERVVSGNELLDAVWPGVSVGLAALSGAVHKARQAIGDDGDHQTLLRTVRGHGFQFVAEVEDVAASPIARRSRSRWLVAAGIAAVLLAAASAWLLTRPAPVAPSGHTLAVLPFVNMSADPDQAPFADGIAEELLNTVAHFEGLRVVGRTSSFSFRDSDADLQTIGEKLGADVILEGSVRTEGDRARITAQLVDAQDGVHRWSESYDRELKDVLTIQTEIATAIAAALRVELTPEQRQRLTTPPTRNLAAYQAYLLGRRRLEQGSPEEAVGLFEQALELDPKLALAYAGLTEAYLSQFESSDSPPDEMLARAQASADKALELDDRLAEAHVALGHVRWLRNDFEGAEVAFQRALALNPNSTIAYGRYGHLLNRDLARYEEALALSRKAVELDPLSLQSIDDLVTSLYSLGRFDEGLAWCERALEIDPGYAWGHQLIAFYHWWSGRLDEAVVWWTKSVALNPEDPFTLAFLGALFLDLGEPDRAEHWIHRSMELGPEGPWTNACMQALELYRGDEAAALQHGQKAFAIWPHEVLTLVRDQEVRAGRYSEARALYEELYPELLDEHNPRVDGRNYLAAVDLALIASRTGKREWADRLLDRSLQEIEKRPRLGRAGFGFADVQIHAFRGDKQKALASLRQAIDEGMRYWWWWWLQKPDMDSLHDEPEFQAMLAEIRADMAAQLEHVREMERRGELVFPAASPGKTAPMPASLGRN